MSQDSLVRKGDQNEAAGAADTALACSYERRWLRWVDSQGGDPCDQLTQADAGRTPAANYSESRIRGYLYAVEQFARRLGKSPDKPGPEVLRNDQAYLLTERKLAVGSVVGRVAALRFCFVRSLKRREFREELPYPKDSKDRQPSFHRPIDPASAQTGATVS